MPTAARLFVEAELQAGSTVPLSAGQARYLGAVLRRGPGEAVVLFNGREGEWAARLTELRRDRGACEVERRLRPQAAEPDAWLLFAPLKRDATELVVEKATELGVSELRPMVTGRTNPRTLNLDRLDAIAIEAAEQCERLTVPRILAPVPLFEALAAWPDGRPLVAALERREAPPVRPARGPAALLIGPEGGLTPAELDVLRRTPFIVPASLGPRILRAETAAIAGLALLLGRHDG
jgi:16S rRNA (uracil1498-N3)-methyltransferase